MTKPFTMLAALIFTCVALVHVYRLYKQFPVMIGSHSIPMWASYLGILIPGLLAVMLYRESKS
jgi:hypothetical protein